MEGERSRLVPLLSSIVGKQIARDRNPKQEETEKRNARWFSVGNERYIYSLSSVAPFASFRSLHQQLIATL
jgi:hypothetical protein